MTLTTKARFRIVLTTASCWLLVGTCAAGIAETFEVTNGNDAGPGSLRDAVAQAQVSPSDNRIIQIAPGVQIIQLTTGSIEISTAGNYFISGVLASGTTIDAGQSSRILSVMNPDTVLNLSALVLRDGQTIADAPASATCEPGSGHGGAVCTLGLLNLFSVGVVNNGTVGDQAHGGAIYTEGGVVFASSCTAPGLWCVFSGNSTAGSGASGGAIFSKVELQLPEMNSIVNYRFENNHAMIGLGGAIRAPSVRFERLRPLPVGNPPGFVGNSADIGGALGLDCASSPEAVSLIQDVVFEDNLAQRGGGAVASIRQCRLEVVASQFTGNDCRGGGGGAISSDHISGIRQTRLEENSCEAPGGAIAGVDVRLMDSHLVSNATSGDENHGGAVAASALLMTGTTMEQNKTDGRFANGGGVWVLDSLEIGNSTISNNAAPISGSGGGGLYFSGQGMALNLWSSTVYQNQAARGGGGVLIAGDPVGSLVEFDIISTILARNQPDSYLLEDLGATSQVNVIQSVFGDPAMEILGSDSGTLFSNDPGINPLEDNGCELRAGTTFDSSCPPNHRTDPSSIGVDAGNNPGGFDYDQRGFGFPRTFGLQSDIGAIEWNPDPSLRIVPEVVDFGTVVDGATLPPEQTLSLHNDGPGVLFLEDFSSLAGVRRDFAECEAASPLGPGESCAASVELLGVAFGVFEDHIEIESNDPQSPERLQIRYFGTTGAQIVLNRTLIEFGDQAVGMSSPGETVLISNAGSQPLALNQITTQGDAFAIAENSCPGSLPSGDNCAIDVIFTPAATGVVAGTLQIRSNSNFPDTLTEVVLTGTSGIVFLDGFE